ncbi:Ref family protein [Paenalcaligenes niemegkensis]|uniref:Ref family recombination enhancement nuclease n=1 Tax=Paenalcaligenes niemegkensis TaxID=2895469 RepID=UPI001EE98C83|nr:Ref family recombination enhancement nuclease [Paenalcaligenes niemegkensis]MCQ9618368.1 Ref family protein [Paenalcaligenes niemegkensis]
MKAWNSTLKQGKPLQRGTWSAGRPKAMKSRGMKGRAVTTEQKRFHDRLAEMGCTACRRDGVHQPIVSIHHIDGRTKPDAHWFVLPLCAGHHQDGTGVAGLIAVHPWKTRFEERYGRQVDLLRLCIEILIERGCDVPAGALSAAGMERVEA